MAWHGAKVYLSDISPGALSLASLRDPELLRHSNALGGKLRIKLKGISIREKPSQRPEYCSEWLSQKTRDDLKKIFEQIGFDRSVSPFDDGNKFWKLNPSKRLPLAIAVLAARSLTCFRTTDNQTWLRKGGVTPTLTVGQSLLQSLESWMSFASNACKHVDKRGELAIATWNVEKGAFRGFGSMDAIVVSPPYANRLDYGSLWAPENAILSALYGRTTDYLKSEQVGSTVVKNKRPSEEDVRILPAAVVKALRAIRSNSAHASDSYYYPFFANYALSLTRAVESWAALLKKGGRLLVFVRDTLRKDQLFPTDNLVSEASLKAGLYVLNGEPRMQVIPHHIGLLRKGRSSTGLHGLAQQEWWLIFGKP
jgi:hypothetical protein